MTEAQRIAKLEAVQMELFALSREREQLQLKLRTVRKKCRRLWTQKSQLRLRETSREKRCRKCNVTMVAGCFYKDARYKDGLYPYCRICKADMATANHERKKAA